MPTLSSQRCRASVPPSGDLAPGQRRHVLMAVGGVDAFSAAFLAPRAVAGEPGEAYG